MTASSPTTPRCSWSQRTDDVASDQYAPFRADLINAGLLVDEGVDGLYGRSAAYEKVAAGVSRLTTELGTDDHATTYHFPPIIPRTLLVQTDYLKSFPDLT